MFFHRALGQFHGAGDLAVGAAVDAVEQEDLPRTLRQAAQRRLHMAQLAARLQRRLRRGRLGQLLLGEQGAFGAQARAFAAHMVDGQVMGAAQQVAAQVLHRGFGTAPEAQEQVLHQIRRGGPAADLAAHHRLHLLPAGEEGPQEILPARGFSGRAGIARRGIGRGWEVGHGGWRAGASGGKAKMIMLIK
ncbi:hypothetical protein D3C85_1366640 [compost metagenome]